jgi:hypothetical protein
VTRAAGRPSLAAEPWRLFFPLGIVLAWAGVSHWTLVWLGLSGDASSAFHAIAQIDGFVWCFALGFLFTMLPRRTGSPPPSRVDLAAGVAVPLLAVGLARLGAFAASQSIWLGGCVLLLRFVSVRLLRGSRRAPAGFVWIPLALLSGILGAVATAVGGAVDGLYEGHRLGKLLVTQGMAVGLVLGAGSVAIPLLTRGEGPPDAGDDAIPEIMGHAFAAFCLLGSFVVEVFVDPASGHALRALTLVLMLTTIARAHRPPTLPGCNRWLVWVAAWMLPLGYLVAALHPGRPQLGLHLAFVGGLAPLALAVGLHATLAHGGQRERLGSWSLGALAPGLLLLSAVVLRSLAELDLAAWGSWLGLAAIAFLAATLAWLVRAWAALRGAPPGR